MSWVKHFQTRLSRTPRSLCAAIYVQFATLAVQLLLAPIFLNYWDAERYGAWLAFLSFALLGAHADLGFGIACANRTALAAGRAQRTTHRLLALGQAGVLIIPVATLPIILTIAAFLIPASLATAPLLACLLLLCLVSCLSSYYFHLSKVSRNRNQHLTVFATTKVFEGIALAILLNNNKEEVELLLAQIVGHIAYCAYQRTSILKELGAEIKLTPRPRWTYVAQLLKMGLNAALYPATLALALQWPVLLASNVLSAIAVTQIITLRTLARVVLQLSNIASIASARRIIVLHSEINPIGMRNAIGTVLKYYILSAIVFCIALFYFGESIYEYWLGETTLYSKDVFLILLVSAALGGLWQCLGSVLSTLNKHHLFVFKLCSLHVLGLPLAIVLNLFFPNSVHTVLLPLLAIDAAMCFILLRQTSKMLKE